MSLEFKGTKGEWSFNSGKAITCNKKSIADVWKFDVGIKEMEANAKLIAAAPDLLDALQKLVAVFDYEKQTLYKFAKLDIDKANKAIEKALK